MIPPNSFTWKLAYEVNEIFLFFSHVTKKYWIGDCGPHLLPLVGDVLSGICHQGQDDSVCFLLELARGL